MSEDSPNTHAVDVDPAEVDSVNLDAVELDSVKLDAVKLELLSRHWPYVRVANILATTAAAVLLSSYFPWQHVAAWCAITVALMVVRGLFWLRERNMPESPAKVTFRIRLYVALATLAGATWGVAALAFLNPAYPTVFLFLVLTPLMMTAGAIPAFATFYRLYVAFAAPSIGLLIIKLALIGSPEAWWLVTLSSTFLFITALFAYNLQSTISTSITTDFRNAELLEAVTQAKEEAERANESKSHFLAAASHDVRQPLHAMGMYLVLLNSRTLDAQARTLLERVNTAHHTLESMFNALLEVSRLGAGTVIPSVRTVELGRLVDKLIDEVSPAARDKGLSIGKQGSPSFVESDEVLLERMLRNLLANAVRYTDSGDITIAWSVENERVHVDVIDSGVGIPEHEQERIFWEYYQVDNAARRREEGLGLGLSVVMRLSKLLDHPVDVASKPGTGSRFRLSLPRASGPERALPSPDFDESAWQPLRCLVVDDDPLVLDAMEALLASWGVPPLCAASAEEALDLVSAHPGLDALIVDYRLGGHMAGDKLIEELRACGKRAYPAVVISGDTDRALKEAMRNRGFPMLRKPVKPAHLRTALMRLQENHQGPSSGRPTGGSGAHAQHALVELAD